MNEKLIKKDFYDAINGKWVEEAKIPDHLHGWGSFYELDENIRNIKSSLLKKWSKNTNEIKNEKLLQEMIKYYSLIKDWKSRDKNGVKPAINLISQILELRSWEDIQSNYKNLVFKDFYVPISFFIMEDFKDSTKNIMWMEYPETILPAKSFYNDKHPKKQLLLTVWSNMVKKLLSKFFDDEQFVDKQIKQAIEFDATLAKYILSSEELAIYPNLYNMFTIEDIQKNCSFLKLDTIVNELTNNNVSKISVISKDFLKNIDTIYNSKNQFELYKSILLIRAVLSFAPLLSDECRIIASEYSNALKGIEKPLSKEKYEIKSTMAFYETPFGLYYGKTYFGEKAKADVEQMIKNMIDIYSTRLKNNNWLAEETKKNAIKKLSKIDVMVGYPTKIKPYYEKFVVNKYNGYDDLIMNTLQFSYYVNEYNFSRYLKPTDKNYWSMSATTVNAYYSPNKNHIVFPAAILTKPFYDINQTSSENYGGIGSVIAHEISHAFDNNGANFDENGNMINWWTKEDKENFEKRTKGMIDLFDGQESGVGKCNGKLTVSENIADAGGLSCAYEAATREKDFDGKKFYINFAAIWRVKYREEYAKQVLEIDVHAPAKLRVNVQVKNSDGFYKAFDVIKGDEMYLEPDKRVKIW